MTNVYWLTQTASDVPPEKEWLGVHETQVLQGLRYAPRRSDWRLGRWTAKCAVAAYLNQACSFEVLSNIEIRPAASGAPEVCPLTTRAEVTISLSHRDGAALCAVAPSGISLGCDLELIEPHSDSFLRDYFTREEQERVARSPAADRSLILSLLWSAKESALKALHTGLRLDTRDVIVSWNCEEGAEALSLASRSPIGLNHWLPLHVRCGNGQVFHGWWQRTNDFVQTLVASPPPHRPLSLSATCVDPGIEEVRMTVAAIDRLRQA